jgi:hypothetical protein
MLLHHVIPSHLNSSSFENEATPATLAGSHNLRINIYNATENRVSKTKVLLVALDYTSVIRPSIVYTVGPTFFRV